MYNRSNKIRRKHCAPCILMTSSFLNNFKDSRNIKFLIKSALIVANHGNFKHIPEMIASNDGKYFSKLRVEKHTYIHS